MSIHPSLSKSKAATPPHMESMMYRFSGPPQVSRKSMPAARVTSPNDMPGSADLGRWDDGETETVLWDGGVRCENKLSGNQAMLVANETHASIDVRPGAFSIIARAR